jgi:DNA-damage-inducible protein J
MPNTHIHVRIDEDVKTQAQDVFDDMGMDITTAVNIFFRQVVRNRCFPFLPSADPFYSESNIAHLMNVKADADIGRNMIVRDLIED